MYAKFLAQCLTREQLIFSPQVWTLMTQHTKLSGGLKIMVRYFFLQLFSNYDSDCGLPFLKIT